MYKRCIPLSITIVLIISSLLTACKCEEGAPSQSTIRLEEDKINQTKILGDGRTIGYAEYGDPHGKPIFFFHGFPGSRFEAELFHDVALELNVRIIAVDRPGMGLSSFQKNRTLLDWPDDIVELADKLWIDDFAVMGISGGGPYATVCAYKISPSRLKKVGIISGMGPAEDQCVKKAMSGFQSFGSWLNNNLVGVAQGGQEIEAFRLQHDTSLYSMKKSSDPVDQNALKLSGVTDILYKANIEAFRQGARGVTWDGRVITGSWGFDLRDINDTVDIYIWHGCKDCSVSCQIGQCVAEAIPNCKYEIISYEGHLSLRINHDEEILTTLTSGW